MKHNEFNLAEIFSNSSNGKTSIGKTIGTYIIVIGTILFSYAIIFLNTSINFPIILTQCLALIGIGSGMIYNKINKPTTIKDNSEVSENKNNSENNK